MIGVGPHHAKLWIASIAPLPSMYKPNTILHGSMFAVTDEIYGKGYQIYQGRDIEILPGLTKYKLEVVWKDDAHSNEYRVDVVGIATQPFAIQDIKTPRANSINFFPIYIYTGKECLLCIEGINDLFTKTGMVCSATGTNNVMSPMCLVNRIGKLTLDVTSESDVRYARVGRKDGILDMLMMLSTMDLNPRAGVKHLIKNYSIPFDYVPLELQFLTNVRTVGELSRFMHPYGCIPSDIARMCMESSCQWNYFYDLFQKSNVLPTIVGDVFMSDAEDWSYTGRWLDAIMSFPERDFSFDVRVDDRDASDCYARTTDVCTFKKSYERIHDWSTLMDMIEFSFNGINWDEHLSVHRTWLEDMIIKNKDGKIILYIDLVAWILACAEGLINTCIIDAIDPFTS